MSSATTLPRSKYRLGRRIGGGGMAEVFQATMVGAEGFERPVAIKRILPTISDDPQFAAMFVNEARISALLHHANIVQVLDFDRDDDGRLFLAMELVDGVDLATLMQRGPLPAPVAIYVITEVLAALAHAHDLLDADGAPLRIVHRDVSPHNVLIGRDGAVKLTDFGIAKALGAASGKTSEILKGKPLYMAPEQVLDARTVDHRADLFATGAILYELLTHERLYRGTTTEEILADVISVARGLRTLAPPPECARLLDPRPDGRFASARAARHHLLATSAPATDARATLADLARQSPAPDSPAFAAAHSDSDLMRAETRTMANAPARAPRTRSRRWPAALLLVVGLGAIGVVWFALARSREPEHTAQAPIDAAPRNAPVAVEQLTRNGSVSLAALSPDGHTMAYATDTEVILRSVDHPEEGERQLAKVSTLVVPKELNWSPDGKALLLGARHEEGGAFLQMIDVRSGKITRAGGGAIGTFLRSNEVATLSSPGTPVTLRVGDASGTAQGSSECQFAIFEGHGADSISYLHRTDSIVVEVVGPSDKEIYVLDRTCKQRALIKPAVKFSSYALDQDRDEILLHTNGKGLHQVAHYSRMGQLLGEPDLVSGEIEQLIAMHAGKEFVIEDTGETTFQRLQKAGQVQELFHTQAMATFALSPDGTTVTWIEQPSVASPRGALRIERIDRMAEQGPPITDAAVLASWSPAGDQIAVTTDDDDGQRLQVMAASAKTLRRVSDVAIDAALQPIWLDEHRVVARGTDLTLVWFDLASGAHGEFLPKEFGTVGWAQRSSRDGRIATIARRSGEAPKIWLFQPGAQPKLLDGPLPFGGGLYWADDGRLVTVAGDGDINEITQDGRRQLLTHLGLARGELVGALDYRADDDIFFTRIAGYSDVFVISH